MTAAGSHNRYRTFWPRLGAAFIDAVVLFPIVYLADPDRYAPGNGAVAILLNVVASGVPLLYSVLLHAKYGQTLGKMAFRVRVMDVSESRLPTLRQAFLRDIGEVLFDLVILGQLVFTVASGQYITADDYVGPHDDALMWANLVWVVLEFVTMVTNRKRRAIHDFIAGTVVVRDAG